VTAASAIHDKLRRDKLLGAHNMSSASDVRRNSCCICVVGLPGHSVAIIFAGTKVVSFKSLAHERGWSLWEGVEPPITFSVISSENGIFQCGVDILHAFRRVMYHKCMHNASKSRMLRPQTEQICLVF